MDIPLIPARGSFAGRLSAEDMLDIEQEAAGCIADLLVALRIEFDEHTGETPLRVARMLVREVFQGRFAAPPEITDFPNTVALDQVYAVGPVSFRSCCAHHLVPIIGQAWIGVLPTDRLIGLSKFSRLVGWIMQRPSVQEDATQMLADALEEAIKPQGLAVVVRARHFCCVWRGIRDEGQLMTTSVMRGLMRSGPTAHAEFLGLIRGMGY